MPDRREEKELDQKIVREWIAELPARTGKKLNAIAKLAGLATSTLTNPVNRSDKVPHTTSAATLLKVSRVTGVPLPAGFADNVLTLPAAPGLQEEATEFRYDAPPEVNDLISSFCGGRPGVGAWVLHTSAVSRRGYLPGSIVVLDTNAEWGENQVVCANWYPKRHSQPQTIWRVFRREWLYADSIEPQLIEPVNEADCDRMGIVLFGLTLTGLKS